MVAAMWAAPPSGRSSRLTLVTTANSRRRWRTVSATRRGSSSRSGCTRPPGMLQNVQCRVQTCPMSRNVAVPLPKHSPRLGQFASSHTVFRLAERSRRFISL